ncbi:ABC transporter permease [Ramlibacter sp. PS4R-6]|uniref:ABC transporter permease n=1 Tax=Ramlibacter sp. PS4R-6 TaxID=3133438 RepID=UPI0030A7C85E
MGHTFRQMLRIAAKEWQLLLRNPHGLAVLFLMPGIFVLVMSFTLKNTLIQKIELPRAGWVVEDQRPAARQWVREWLAQHGGTQFASRQELRDALKARRVEAGVVVPPTLFGAENRPDASKLEMWLGNLVQPAAAARLRTELTFSLVQVQMKVLAANAGPFASVLVDGTSGADLLANGTPAVRYLYEIESGRAMTAVQQSVPAWLVFGMFFVVIPIAGVLIQERNEGTLDRLATLGVSADAMLGGKLAAFVLLNWVQLAFMVLVGRWLVPLLGGDALHLDVSVPWFLLIVLATSAAAVALALLIAAYTRTFDHAAALGGGLNVILGAIAGVMVPRMLMPPGLQRISEWSPMGWALDGMQSVFLGDPTPGHMWPRIGLLVAFAAVCLALSWRALRRRHLGPAG